MKDEPQVAMDMREALLRSKTGRMTLKAIEAKVRHMREARGEPVPVNLQASIRCQAQRRCSKCKQWQGKEDWFRNPNHGVWEALP
jgi:hypothetical protein